MPAAHRSAITHAKPLSYVLKPLLEKDVAQAQHIIGTIFPYLDRAKSAKKVLDEEEEEQDNMDEMLAMERGFRASSIVMSSSVPPVFRPRLLIHGKLLCGQSQVATALLYILEELPVTALDMASLLANSGTKVQSVKGFRLILAELPSGQLSQKQTKTFHAVWSRDRRRKKHAWLSSKRHFVKSHRFFTFLTLILGGELHRRRCAQH